MVCHGFVGRKKILWSRIKNVQLGVMFRPQVELHGYRVDFFCHDAGLIVEVDGAHHEQPGVAAYDGRRDEIMSHHGYRTLRIPAALVRQRRHRVDPASSDAPNPQIRCRSPRTP